MKDFNLFATKYRISSKRVKDTYRHALKLLGVSMGSFYQSLQYKELPELTLKQIAVMKKALRISDEELLEELKKIPGSEFKFLNKLEIENEAERKANETIAALESKLGIKKVQ